MRQNIQTKLIFNLKPTLMLEFIFIPVIFGIVTLGVYRIVELFVRRRERMLMIEKLGHPGEAPGLLRNAPFPLYQKRSFNSLKASILLIGLGFGLLSGFLISRHWLGTIPETSWMAFHVRETVNIIYGASVLFFGGIGLLLSFFLERKYIQREKNEQGQ